MKGEGLENIQDMLYTTEKIQQKPIACLHVAIRQINHDCGLVLELATTLYRGVRQNYAPFHPTFNTSRISVTVNSNIHTFDFLSHFRQVLKPNVN